AEVADEQVVAEALPARRRPREAPRRVEVATGSDSRDERAVGLELADEAEARPVDLVVGDRILFRVGHEDIPTKVLDAERRIAGGDPGIDEGAGPGLEGERAVEDIDATVVEAVGGELT